MVFYVTKSHSFGKVLCTNGQPEGNNWAQSVSTTNNNNNNNKKKTTSLRFQCTEIFYFVGENN